MVARLARPGRALRPRDSPPGALELAWLRILYLLVGLGLLGLVLLHTDLSQVGARLSDLGAPGAGALALVYLLAFLCDTAAWQLMLPSASVTRGWFYRLWKIRMVGEAFNLIVPAGSLGGEPVKAALLKKHEAIGYKEGAASLVMAKTVTLLTLLAFSGAGLVVMTTREALPPAYRLLAGLGFAALCLGVVGFFAVQRWKVASRLAAWAARFRAGRRLESALLHIQDVDDHFVQFYARRRGRFAAAAGLAMASWLLGASELYLIMGFLGQPVTWSEAWMMEAVVQLVRAGSFFIPANLGATEAGLVLLAEALTGQPAAGLAAAIVRRGRELLWVTWGLALGWRLSSLPGRNTLTADPEQP